MQNIKKQRARTMLNSHTKAPSKKKCNYMKAGKKETWQVL